MTHSFRAIEIALAAMIAVMPLGAATPASAGSNSTTPAATPATPPATITNLPPLTAVNQGGCAQQYTAEINRLHDLAIVSDDVGLIADGVAAGAAGLVLAANITGAIADGVAQGIQAGAWATGGTAMAAGGAAMEAAATVVLTPPAVVAGGVGMIAGGAAMGVSTGAKITQGVATAAKITALTLEVGNVAAAGTAVIAHGVAQGHTKNAQALTNYIATLPNCNAEFTGTVEVSGGGVNVTGTSIFNDDVGVAGNVNVEDDVNASQVHATQGISADGGAIWLGDVNGTTYSDGINIGGGAVSGAGFGGAPAITGDVHAIAIGNNAQAMMSGSLALGLDSSSIATDAIAIGNSAAAKGAQDVVVGALNNTDVGGNNTVVGNEIDIIGAASSSNTVLGVGHQVTGSGNFVGGDPNTVVGSLNVATGVGSSVTGDSNVAIGDSVNIVGNRAIAVGNSTAANADDTTVIGTNARANATGSAAYGQGAVANLTQQQVFGTQANTYTTPGITSGLSRDRQSGPLEVATSDAAGNLATDGGEIFKTLSENRAGVAIAMAMQSPDLRGDERFGIGMNWGVFQKSHGLGLSAIGVVSDNLFGTNERIALQGGFGISVDEESFGGRRADTVYGGRAGLQVTW